MTVCICASVYYTIIKMAVEKCLISGENVYDILLGVGVKLPVGSQMFPHHYLLSSMPQGAVSLP